MIVRATYHAYNELGARRHPRGGGGADRQRPARGQAAIFVTFRSSRARCAARRGWPPS